MQSSTLFARRQGQGRLGTARSLCRLWQVRAACGLTCHYDVDDDHRMQCTSADDRTVSNRFGRWCIADVVRIRTGETGAAGERMAGGMADRMDSDDES